MKNLLLALLVYHMCNIVNANHWKCIQTFNHCCFALKWTSKEVMLPVYYIGMIFDKIYNLPHNSTKKIGENSLSLTCTWFYINLFEENKIFERNIPNINPKKKCIHKKTLSSSVQDFHSSNWSYFDLCLIHDSIKFKFDQYQILSAPVYMI